MFFRQRFLRFRAVTTKTKKSQNLALIGRDADLYLKLELTLSFKTRFFRRFEILRKGRDKEYQKLENEFAALPR
jgi:hypothetical protein